MSYLFYKNLKKIFHKKHNFSYEEILQESALLKMQNYQQKMHISISNLPIYLLMILFIIIFIIFIYKSYDFQIKNFSFYQEKSQTNQQAFSLIFANRGNIIDRNGVDLVKNIKIGTENNEYERIYSKIDGISHVVGYTSSPKKDKKGIYWQNSWEGISGVEEYYNNLLSGKSGKEYYQINAKGEIENTFYVEKAISGKNLHLSIDSKIQEKAYQLLKDFVIKYNYTGASLLLSDLENGDLIVLTNYPEYKNYKMLEEDYFKSIKDNKNTPFLNRAISGLYAPGSIIKPVLGLAALEEKIIDKEKKIFSNGQLVYIDPDSKKKFIYKDWRANGWTNLKEAIAVSSDVFFYQIGGGFKDQIGLGIKKIDEYSELFYMNKKIGIDLNGEKEGNVPTPEWKKKVFNDIWRIGDTYITSIGQFGYLMTPIEALFMTSLIAGQGEAFIPHLFKTSDTNELIKVKIDKEINKDYYNEINEGMRMTTLYGTAKSLNVDYTNIATKTGTAEVGKNKEKVHSWVIGYWPYTKPKYAFVVIAENGPAKKSKSTTEIILNLLNWLKDYDSNYFKK